jgi:aminoglycoside phosphotransferase (APT) family kinase protein
MRLHWEHLPPPVRRGVERRLGSPVESATSQDSGFTPGFASRLLGRDGQRLFVKAANRTAQKAYAAAYAQEARLLGALPMHRLPAPPLRWVEEDLEGWTVVAFEDVEGRPPHRPWADQDLSACLDALATLAEVAPDPAPLDLQPLHVELPTFVTGWDTVDYAGVDWPHADELRDLAHAYADLPHLDAFVHTDARDDNFVVRPDGSALLCDWNWPALGPRWLDVVNLLVSVHGDGHDVTRLVAEHPVTAGVPSDHLDSFVAALGGFMAEADLRPVPTTSPHLGTHRRWWAAACWSWLATRRGWR